MQPVPLCRCWISMWLLMSIMLTGCSATPGQKVSAPKQLPRIEINIAEQKLHFYSEAGEHKVYPVSTAKLGTGQNEGSLQTPLGKHVVIEKVGDGLPWNAVFKYGAFTGKYYSPDHSPDHSPDQKPNSVDPILTRIIRLAGTEPGFNSGPGVDSEQRRIYIHGTPPSEMPEAGIPRSRGCIRMSPRHIIDLYDQVTVGMEVIIQE